MNGLINQIRSLMQRRCVSEDDLADQTGIPRGDLKEMLENPKIISLGALNKISEYLNGNLRLELWAPVEPDEECDDHDSHGYF